MILSLYYLKVIGVMNPHQKSYFTRQDLCEALLVSLSTIKRCEATGELKATRLGPRIVRYHAADVQQFLKRWGSGEPPNPDQS